MSHAQNFSGRRRTRLGLALVGGMGVMAIFIAAFAPYVDAELSPWVDPHVIVDPSPAKIAKGRMVDDYFAVEEIGANTYAIGEPRYYQQNYSYLLIGDRRALLFDAGSGTRNIGAVVTSLTSLPVTVLVSHLHYDHLAGIAAFRSLAMIDLPDTRGRLSQGRFTPSRYEYLGFTDGERPPAPRVSEWLKPGDSIDLGGRVLTVLSTPGHTPTSIALFEPADTLLWTAHCCRKDGVAAPWLTMADLRDLDVTLTRIRNGETHSTGFYPRIFRVNDQMDLATGFPWNNR